MIVICNSSKDFSVDRINAGDAFIFGKTRMLLRAEYVVLTDRSNNFFVVRKSDIVWSHDKSGATHTIKIRSYATLRPFELNAACPQFNSRVFGTVAFRNVHFEKHLAHLTFTNTSFGGLYGSVSCIPC